ncbi:VWA domain-containing protein [Arthrobacter sp. MYb227]|uniref:DUF7507 domain-containing protein n=1 Tax=Arthrobacter sp. MYb227 TaxID=1848601 RepID=UPI0015E32D4D|nr:VWA domain-containing protein [Arthrobacter sp. MYb227]
MRRFTRVLGGALALTVAAGAMTMGFAGGSAGLPAAYAAADTAEVKVKVASKRTGSGNSDFSPRAGTTLKLVNSDGTNFTAASWGTCRSDSAGICTFTVPETGKSQTNRDKRPYIQESNPASGDFTLPKLNLTRNLDNSQGNESGRIQLPREMLRAGKSTLLPATGNASSSFWATGLKNPQVVAPKCGLRIGMLVDLSASLKDSQKALRTAATTFVDGLEGTPTQIAMWTFAGGAPAKNNANLPLTSVASAADATIVRDKAKSLTVVSTGSWEQGTNWDAGLWQVANAPAGENVDVLLMLTDGDPTRSTITASKPDGPGNSTYRREVERAVFSANAVKARGTRIVAVGIGSGVSSSKGNLAAISGNNAGTDYTTVSDYTALGSYLKSLAAGYCDSTVNVIKQVTNDAGDLATAQPSAGWRFNAEGKKISPTNGVTDESGAVSFKASDLSAAGTTPVTITETDPQDHTLVQVKGKNAVCTKDAGQTNVPVTNQGTHGFTVDAVGGSVVTCHVYNQPPTPKASLSVSKSWVINGKKYADGSQPKGFEANLLIDEKSKRFATEYDGYEAGYKVKIDETTKVPNAERCTIGTTQGDLGTKTLATGLNKFSLTNVVDCTSEVVLKKIVMNGQSGTAIPNEWTLTLTPSGSTTAEVSTPGSTKGSTHKITPETAYKLSEKGDRAGYTLASLQCSTGIDGAMQPLEGTLSVAHGASVTCEFTNVWQELTVKKQGWKLTSLASGKLPTAEHEIPSGSPAPSGTMSWSYTVTNRGAMPVNGITVRDDKLAKDAVSCPATQLAPGKSMICTASGPIGME